MLTDEEMERIYAENEQRKKWKAKAAPGNFMANAEVIALAIADDPATAIDRLLAEVRELCLLLRDAVQDATPGNRLWREGVKAGLEAAAKVAQEAKESEMVQTAERATAWYACDMIRGLICAIDPASILP